MKNWPPNFYSHAFRRLETPRAVELSIIYIWKTWRHKKHFTTIFSPDCFVLTTFKNIFKKEIELIKLRTLKLESRD